MFGDGVWAHYQVQICIGRKWGPRVVIRFILGVGATNRIWTSYGSLGPSMLITGVLVQYGSSNRFRLRVGLWPRWAYAAPPLYE